MTGNPVATGVVGVVAAAIGNVLTMQGDPTTPVFLIPAINITAIVAFSMTMGMLFNRVRELERRMDKTQRVVFHEDDPWDGIEERRTRRTRKK